MKKSEKTLALIVFILIIIWICLSLTRKPTKATRASRLDRLAGVPVAEDTSLTKEPLEEIAFENIPEEKDISRTWILLGDPFIKLESEKREIPEAEESSELVLEGVVWSENLPRLAVINDTNVTEGDIISGFKVEEIQKDRVILSKKGKQYIVEFEKENKKK